ncbi:MAG: hypothetical protein KBT70_08305 [Roseovarius sp.]|uniref:hypothetical protein n=1 Tax=Roseovarius TaxID=74030 RepID=UPI001B4C8FDE|nr:MULTISPECIES: hypothetical protein [Roseovarius]MBQ0750190.1 hypothetical protein [Roseovarius sp.]MBW4976237.1 hypothetical protein [Roseovarius mucosus]
MTRIALSALLIALTGPVLAQQNTTITNEICSETPRGSQGFDLRRIGPILEGSWSETAGGIGATMGVQRNEVEIFYDPSRNRLYLGGDGMQTELVPVQGGNKELRHDFVSERPMAPELFATKSDLAEWAYVLGCDMGLAPQFSWQIGSGTRRAEGIISFFSETEAIGTKWNSAGGAREVSLTKK